MRNSTSCVSEVAEIAASASSGRTRSSPSRAAQCGNSAFESLADVKPAVELDAMALAVIEADRLDALEAIERPGEAGRRILAAGIENERRLRHFDLNRSPNLK